MHEGKLKEIPEQAAWLSDQMAKSPAEPNPCRRFHGPGPEGVTCTNCTHLYAVHKSKTYWKCNLRKHTNGPASDHRVRWLACAKYEKEKSP